jgi:hypothetical protein
MFKKAFEKFLNQEGTTLLINPRGNTARKAKSTIGSEKRRLNKITKRKKKK